MTPQRLERIKSAVRNRQLDFAVILENVHDPHNVGAVLRSCDSVGIQEVYLLITDPQISVSDMFLSKRASSGARKWIDVYLYRDMKLCISDVRKKYKSILGTKLGIDSKMLYEYDLTNSIAIAFGNEHEGLSDSLASHMDGNIEIPQFGMVQSLNISVACAVVLFEGLRQRMLNNKYQNHSINADKKHLLEKFTTIQEQKPDKNFPTVISK